MKTLKLTIAEITELQPTEVSCAAERGTVIGGIEVTGEIDHDILNEKCAEYFGKDASLYGEGNDGDECVHYVVLAAETQQSADDYDTDPARLAGLKD